MFYLLDLASLKIFFFVLSSDFSRVTANSKSIYHLTYRRVSGITFIRYVHSKSLEIQIIKKSLGARNTKGLDRMTKTY